jgi:hypothetical protein
LPWFLIFFSIFYCFGQKDRQIEIARERREIREIDQSTDILNTKEKTKDVDNNGKKLRIVYF